MRACERFCACIALRTLHHVELHLLAFREGAKAVGLDGRVVAEDILATAVLRE